MKQYNKDILGNDKAELIHASLDSSEDSAEKWAAKAQFPWLTVLDKDIKRAGLEKFKPRGVPGYILIDKEGNKVAEGKTACFAKIK